MQIVRLFTRTGEDVFSRFEYESCDCSIMDHRTGKPSFEFKGAEVPKHWSKNARDVLVSKYFRKGGVPVETLRQSQAGLPDWLAPAQAVGLPTTTERSVKQVVHRLAGHWTFVGFRNGYFEPTPEQFAAAGMRETEDNRAALQDDNARAFYDEMAYMLLAQIAAPNSPQWFNTGLSWAYGITGPKQGHYFVDLPANTKSGLSASDAERTGIAHKFPIDPPNLATCHRMKHAISSPPLPNNPTTRTRAYRGMPALSSRCRTTCFPAMASSPGSNAKRAFSNMARALAQTYPSSGVPMSHSPEAASHRG
jgi:hypothetical protein